MNLTRDERGVIVDWLIRITLLVVVGGVVLFDTGSIVVNRLSAEATADDVATLAANEVAFGGDTFTPAQVEEAVEVEAERHEVKLLKFTYDAAEGTIFVKVRKRATTIVAGRFDVFNDWTRATGQATSSTRLSTTQSST
ncbi:MAG: hypothetical protein ACRDJJ_01370 [Actinomycetota bacterium]